MKVLHYDAFNGELKAVRQLTKCDRNGQRGRRASSILQGAGLYSPAWP